MWLHAPAQVAGLVLQLMGVLAVYCRQFQCSHRGAIARLMFQCYDARCAAGSAIAATEEPELVAPENDDRAAAKLAAAQQKEQQQHHQVRITRCCS